MTAAEPAAPERFAFVHALRGVAALLVVWSHLSGFWLLENGRRSIAQDAWYEGFVRPFHVFQNGGHLGVVLFFLISGFIITHTSLRETPRSFAIRRGLRIFPPLAVATLVAWLLWNLARVTGTDLIGINGGGVLHWLSGLILVDGFLPGGRAIDVTWTLIVEVVFYALTLVFLGLSRRSPIAATWWMISAWVGLQVLTVLLAPLAGNPNASPALFVSFLLIGRVVYLWHRGLMAGFDAVLALASLAVLFGVFLETSSPGFLLAPGGYTGLEPLATYICAFVGFLLLMRLAPRRVVQPFAFLGDISYSLYLLHLPVGITVLNLLDLVGMPESLNSLIAVVVSLAVSWVAFKLIEVPSQRLARRITRRPAAAEPLQ